MSVAHSVATILHEKVTLDSESIDRMVRCVSGIK
jgi:hypothetical protein